MKCLALQSVHSYVLDDNTALISIEHVSTAPLLHS